MKDYSDYYPSKQEHVLKYEKIIFEKQLQGEEGKDVLIDENNEYVRVLIQSHSNPMNEERRDKKLSCWNDINIHMGVIITNKDNKKFLVTSEILKNSVYKKVKIEETDYTLKWLNKNGDICSSSCISEDATKWSDGMYENKDIKVGDTRVQVTFPRNKDTEEFYAGKRFLFSKNRAYEISDTKITSPKGLLKVIMTQTEVHKGIDNTELLIADYKGNAHDYKMEIINKSLILSTNDTYKIQVNVFDRNKKINNPELKFDIYNKEIVSLENNVITGLKEGKTDIIVRFKDITSTINVQVIKEEVDNYSCKIIGEDYVYLGRKGTYEAEFYNNGIKITDDTATWTITDEKGNKTNYATVDKINNGQCVVKVTKDWIWDEDEDEDKYFYLHCKGNTGQEYVKKIRIKVL